MAEMAMAEVATAAADVAATAAAAAAATRAAARAAAGGCDCWMRYLASATHGSQRCGATE